MRQPPFGPIAAGRPRVSVFICDDAADFRALLRANLAEHPDIVVVGEAGDGWTGVEAIVRSGPDVALLDLSMPRMGGLEAISRIRAAAPRTRIAVLTSRPAGEVAERALSLGADRFIEKRQPFGVVTSTIRELAQAPRPA